MADWGKIFDTAATVGGGVASSGIFGGGSMDQNVGNQSATRDPWGVAAPYMTDALDQSRQLYQSGQGSDYYPGQTYTPMGYDTSTGFNQMRDRAMAGSPLMDTTNQALQQTIEGTQNPYLDAIYDQGAGKISDSMKSLYSKAGRYGSDSMARNTGEALGNYATNLYGGAYNQDQNRRMGAMSMAPGMAQQDYADSERLLGIGQGVEGYQTAERQADQDRFNFYQQNPYDRLGQYANMASTMGGMGGTTTGDFTRGTDPGLTSIFGDIGSISGELDNIWGSPSDTTKTDWSSGAWAKY